MLDVPESFRIPPDIWVIIPRTGLAIFQASGTCIVATAIGDDVLVDTTTPIRVRHADVAGGWCHNSAYAESLGHGIAGPDPS